MLGQGIRDTVSKRQEAVGCTWRCPGWGQAAGIFPRLVAMPAPTVCIYTTPTSQKPAVGLPVKLGLCHMDPTLILAVGLSFSVCTMGILSPGTQ